MINTSRIPASISAARTNVLLILRVISASWNLRVVISTRFYSYCRILSNFAPHGMQSQDHGHLHILGGRHLGPYVAW